MPDPRYSFEPVLYQAITPLHVGSGQDVGLVDLPVIRERTTDHPFLPGSGIRGALRDRCEAKSPKLTRRLFGDDRPGKISAGCLSVLDAHVLLFPVRSVPGPFARVTCPFVLGRYGELFGNLTGRKPSLATLPAEPPSEGTFLGGPADSLYLEEYAFERGGGSFAWEAPTVAGDGSSPVALLSDADFLHFVRYATLVRQRNRLSTAKTVLGGALFSVEMLPAETWFYGFVGATRERVAEEDQETDELRSEDPGREAEQEPDPGPDRAAQGEPARTDPADENPAAPMSKEVAAHKLRTLLGLGAGPGSTHVTLGGDESVGLGITKMHWLESAKEDRR